MNQVFADTSFFVAICNPADQLHRRAMEFANRFVFDALTTEYVLVELGNFLRKPMHRTAFLELERELRLDPQSTIVPASSDLLGQGVRLYAKRPDKDWSLTDCISFVVMEEHGLNDALTADHHFEQAGFKVLLG